MKAIKTAVSTLVMFTSLCLSTGYSQQTSSSTTSTPTITGGIATIEMDLGLKKIPQKLPFDADITLVINSVPLTVTGLTLKIYNRKNVAVAEQVINWKRNGRTDQSVSLDFLSPLKPKNNYKLELEQTSSSPLNPSQKIALKGSLKNDPNIANAINVIAHKYIDEQNAFIRLKKSIPPYGAILRDLNTTLVSAFANAAKNVNPNYSIVNADPVSQLQSLVNFPIIIQDALDAIQSIRTDNNTKRDANNTAIIAAIDAYNNKFVSIDWGNLTAADADFASLKALANNIKTAFAIAPANNSANDDHIKTLADPAPILLARDNYKDGIIDKVAEVVSQQVATNSTTLEADLVSNAQLYMTADIGFGPVAKMDRWVVYSGVNIYLRQVSKNVGTGNLKGWEKFKANTAFLLGVTLGSIEKANVRKGLIGNTALVTGIGYRFWDFLKLNVGTLVHYRYDSNPLFTPDRYHLSLSPFVSVSIDVDVKTLFAGVGDSIFK